MNSVKSKSWPRKGVKWYEGRDIDLIQRYWLLLPFDKEDSFVLESAGPVGVDDEVTGSILGDHHRLGLILVKEGLGKGGKICNVILLCLQVQRVSIKKTVVWTRKRIKQSSASTWRYCLCSSCTTILFHLSIFSRIDFSVKSCRNSTLRSFFSSAFPPFSLILKVPWLSSSSWHWTWEAPWHWGPEPGPQILKAKLMGPKLQGYFPTIDTTSKS